MQPEQTVLTGICSFSDLYFNKCLYPNHPKGFYTTNSTFHYKMPSPLPVPNGKRFKPQKVWYPSFLPTHPSLTKGHNPTYFNLPMGITPPATFCFLHPHFSSQRPFSTKTRRLEAPKLTKSFSIVFKLLNIFSRIITTICFPAKPGATPQHIIQPLVRGARGSPHSEAMDLPEQSLKQNHNHCY